MFKKDNYITKRDLDKALRKNEVKFDKKLADQSKIIIEAVDFRFQKTDKKIEENKLAIRSIISILDGISKQLEDLKEESKSATILLKKHEEMWENHEKRICVLEEVPA